MKLYVVRLHLPHRDGKVLGSYSTEEEAQRFIEFLMDENKELNKTEMGYFTTLTEENVT